ncbi:unnamed protein product [Mycena citricolor]|uniref:PUM-HD domain-containing protein n=1 Tax=Mycena citricolor TaxID=2018698 RepID=A0AAD2HBA0_9AGAR|nr:unnamed protein product [Mycena citricolor]
MQQQQQHPPPPPPLALPSPIVPLSASPSSITSASSVPVQPPPPASQSAPAPGVTTSSNSTTANPSGTLASSIWAPQPHAGDPMWPRALDAYVSHHQQQQQQGFGLSVNPPAGAGNGRRYAPAPGYGEIGGGMVGGDDTSMSMGMMSLRDDSSHVEQLLRTLNLNSPSPPPSMHHGQPNQQLTSPRHPVHGYASQLSYSPHRLPSQAQPQTPGSARSSSSSSPSSAGKRGKPPMLDLSFASSTTSTSSSSGANTSGSGSFCLSSDSNTSGTSGTSGDEEGGCFAYGDSPGLGGSAGFAVSTGIGGPGMGLGLGGLGGSFGSPTSHGLGLGQLSPSASYPYLKERLYTTGNNHHYGVNNNAYELDPPSPGHLSGLPPLTSTGSGLGSFGSGAALGGRYGSVSSVPLTPPGLGLGMGLGRDSGESGLGMGLSASIHANNGPDLRQENALFGSEYLGRRGAAARLHHQPQGDWIRTGEFLEGGAAEHQRKNQISSDWDAFGVGHVRERTGAEPINFLSLLHPSSSPPYASFVSRIIKSADQQASIFLQQKLKVAGPEERGRIVDAICARGAEMMMHRFGNWAVQRCLEAAGSADERRRIVGCMRGRVVDLATNCYGCHVLQKALDCDEEDVRLLIVSELLLGDPAATLVNKHASHVWSKVMELSWTPPAPPIFAYVNKALKGKWAALACHETGSLVVQHAFENLEDAAKDGIVDELLGQGPAVFSEVAKSQWGAYCVQHILEHGSQQHRLKTLEHLLGGLLEFATNEQGSKSVMKALKEGGKDTLDRIVQRMCEPAKGASRRALIVDLALSLTGSQLIASVLPAADKDQRALLYDCIRGHIVTLRGCKTGSKVIWLFDRMRAYYGY